MPVVGINHWAGLFEVLSADIVDAEVGNTKVGVFIDGDVVSWDALVGMEVGVGSSTTGFCAGLGG